MSETLSPERLKEEATRLHEGISQKIDLVVKQKKVYNNPDTGVVRVGNNDNFLSFSGVGTDTLRVVVGKTPVDSGEHHRHLDFHHLLHAHDVFKKHDKPTSEGQDTESDDEGKKEEFRPFDAWEAIVKIGDDPQITYVAHEWRQSMVKDEKGREKKGIVLLSPSNQIQDNNTAAVEGIENLTPHLGPQV